MHPFGVCAVQAMAGGVKLFGVGKLWGFIERSVSVAPCQPRM
jgi:hypothetical protein